MGTTTFRRIQVYHRKAGEARFLSHLDVVRTMDRALRRSGLPIRFTEGMNPKVRMSFPTALPLGIESLLEMVEIQVEEGVSVREVCDRLGDQLPPGLRPVGGEALYTGERRRVLAIHYEVLPGEEGLPSAEEVEGLLARRSIPVERRGKKRDLRPLLSSMETDGRRLRVSIAWTDRGTARPEDVLRALGRAPEDHRVSKVGVTLRTSFGETITKRNGPADHH